MKKILLTALSAVLLSAGGFCANSNIDILTLFSSNSKAPNQAWIGTFQLVFNDMKNNIIKRDIEFVKERPTKELKALNDEEFTKEMLNTVKNAKVIFEGGIDSPQTLAKVLETGVKYVVIGGAITRPLQITKRYLQEFKNW